MAQESEKKLDELEILKDLINTKYYEGMESNEPVIKKMLSYLSGVKDVVRVTDPDGLTHLLIGVNTKLEDVDNAILLSGHMDTVKPDWKDTEARVDGDNIYGLGSSDMKAFFAALIANKKELLNSDVPIILSITFDEETKDKGIDAITEELKKRNVNCAYTVVGEPTENVVVTGGYGNWVNVIKVIGKSCHSMCPENGINALYPTCKLINYIYDDLVSEYEGRATFNVILTEGGVLPNQVCGETTVKFSVRTADEKLKDEILGKVQKKLSELESDKKYNGIKTKMFQVFELKAFEHRQSDFNNELVKLFSNGKEGTYRAGTEATVIQKALDTEGIIFGPGDLKTAHQEGEHCSISGLKAYSEMFPKFLKHVAEYVKKLEKKVVKKPKKG